jgi:hypothetical protein
MWHGKRSQELKPENQKTYPTPGVLRELIGVQDAKYKQIKNSYIA